MSNNNSSNPKTKYTMLTPEERQLQINKLVDVWKDFVSINDPSLCEDDFFVNERILIEVVERVSKRKYYFEVFHGLPSVSEYKETALYVFWITKLKPFTVIKRDSPLCVSANELYALHMVISMFEKIRDDKKTENFSYPSESMLSDFVYGLKYQDITKEALIMHIESLAASCGLPVFESNK